ncbi:hypothetical protein LOTGIDRAFT_174128 [Lottia gigantea]|uniref:Uncharacterized protein n=1 Tax=Lottia gigantea TaxID=225164 RepID=V4C9Y3_LOTGI|nr:hypothetical protein LOTGIDRAFT_174128 [Lottia gigantea]ESO98594.1 hypothetical protein LOTGIDRAFT_174128 [Lottia gigantea]
MMDIENGTVSGTPKTISSTTTSQSKTSEKSVETATRAARIATELLFCDEEATQELNLKKLKLKKELAVAKAEMVAIDECSNSSRSIPSRSSHGSLSGRRQVLHRYLRDQAKYSNASVNGDLVTIDSTGSADPITADSLPFDKTVPKIIAKDDLNVHNSVDINECKSKANLNECKANLDTPNLNECKVNLDTSNLNERNSNVRSLSVSNSNVRNLDTSNFIPNVKYWRFCSM